jgi:DNA gyrase inhibitor GyrI
MSIGIIYLRPIEVVRVRAYGKNGEAAQAAWGKMLSWVEDHDCRAHAVRAFGLVYKVGDRNIAASYDACVELNEQIDVAQSEGIETALIPSGAYLRQRFTGPLEKMGAVLRKMRTKDIPDRGLILDEKRPLVEVYLNDFVAHAVDPKIDLCVPVKT